METLRAMQSFKDKESNEDMQIEYSPTFRINSSSFSRPNWINFKRENKFRAID